MIYENSFLYDQVIALGDMKKLQDRHMNKHLQMVQFDYATCIPLRHKNKLLQNTCKISTISTSAGSKCK